MMFDEKAGKVNPPAAIKDYKFDPKTHRYAFNMAGNIKVGNIATWSTLLGDYTYTGMSGKLKNITGTCRNCGECRTACYVRASYRFPSVIFSQAVNTWGLRNELDKVERDLSEAIARRKISIVRINQSGEVENPEQFAMWCRLATAYPGTKFYIYTKMYGIAEEFLLGGLVPENFTVLYSVWHSLGVEEYARVKHLPNVKAFVYDDGVDRKLDTKCYCPAYRVPEGGSRAKMNHGVKCETCRLCIDSKVGIIGCLDH